MHGLIARQLSLLLILITVFSCGRGPSINRGVNGTAYTIPAKITGSALPYKYYVLKDDYSKYKSKYQNIEKMYDETAGKNAVDIIPVDTLPPTLGDSEFTISIVDMDNANSYGNYGNDCVGSPGCYIGVDKGLYVDETSHRSGKIFLNNHFSDPKDFEYTLLHEMGHSLGIDHIEDEISFMNPINSFTHYGFLNNDSARVAALFEFREFAKDLESMGSLKEAVSKDNLKLQLMDRFGLSSERSGDLSNIIFSYNKIKRKRALNSNEKNIFARKLIGVNYEEGKKALENHIQGDPRSLEGIIDKASEINNISPEHVSDLVEEFFF